MPYFRNLEREFSGLLSWLDLAKEQGADTKPIVNEAEKALKEFGKRAEKLKPGLTKYEEPSQYKAILKARPKGPRKLPLDLTDAQLEDKILGAWLGRGAGCVLGIPVEGRNKRFIELYAKKLGQPYPLAEYWKDYPDPTHFNHYSEPTENFLKGKIDHLGADDDLIYTVLGLLILEEKGLDFTAADVANMWDKYLPMACTAERVALDNIKKGMKPPRTALVNNPYSEWIGAAIRPDGFAYCAPGLPELAADFACRDATVSHIKNGIYGEMFWAATIAAAFAVDTPEEAMKIALTEIPAKSRMTETVKETIRWCKADGDWEKTWARFPKRYAGMHPVHTLNNACLTIMGLMYGGGDFEKTISLTVMAGLDTDCTGATAGSVLGAILGARKLPAKWIKPLGDTMTTYINGHPKESISDLVKRCCRIAKEARQRYG